MKKVFLFLQIVLLLSLVVFPVGVGAQSNAVGSVHYISDSEFVSVSNQIFMNCDNYTFELYYPYQLEDVISNNTSAERYLNLFNNTYLSGSSSMRAVITGGNMPAPSDDSMNCLFVFEFVYLLPDISALSDICRELQERGCPIVVIGAFSEYDYGSADWDTFTTYIDCFYQKYPMNFLAEEIVDLIYQENCSYQNVSLFFDRRVLGFDQLSTWTFSEAYKYSPLLRGVFEKIRNEEGYTGDSESLILDYDMKIYMTAPNHMLYSITSDFSADFLAGSSLAVGSDEYFNYEIRNFPLDGFELIVSYYEYEMNFGYFVEKMARLHQAHVLLLDVDNLYPTTDAESNIHVLRNIGDIFALKNYYQENFDVSDFSELCGEDMDIWAIIQAFL